MNGSSCVQPASFNRKPFGFSYYLSQAQVVGSPPTVVAGTVVTPGVGITLGFVPVRYVLSFRGPDQPWPGEHLVEGPKVELGLSHPHIAQHPLPAVSSCLQSRLLEDWPESLLGPLPRSLDLIGASGCLPPQNTGSWVCGLDAWTGAHRVAVRSTGPVS